MKRKHLSDTEDKNPKMLKLEASEEPNVDTQTLDNEVDDIINSDAKRKVALDDLKRSRTPVRSSPRKIIKRRSSANDVTKTPKTPRTPKARPDSVDTTRKTPRKKLDTAHCSKDDDVSVTGSKLEFAKRLLHETKTYNSIKEEENTNDSQNFHLELSPSPEDSQIKATEGPNPNYSSEPVVAKDRNEVLKPGPIHETRSEGYNYSDHNCNLSQPAKDKDTDQETTDSIGSIVLDSPDHIATVASKLISKLSNGNSSTPTEQAADGKRGGLSDSDCTPDMLKLASQKAKHLKGDNSFRVSNSTTPSTISPLPNGHSLPMNTPSLQVPSFDVHVSHNEDGEFLSVYIVRTDNDLGMDMCKEFQRFSKRFTIDPYMADISTSNSPSSVTSGGMINLPNRTSFASTVGSTSTTSSNRTSDGAFVVPQPPRKSVSHPSTTVKGYDALMKKLRDVFSHVREVSVEENNRSATDEKISVGIQASPDSSTSRSNGNASPEEVGQCDKATPKSSLKKTKVRGRRPMAGKTKRAILPTQIEEPEFMHGMNSPEMVTINGGNKLKFKEEKVSSSVTPKSVGKMKQKRSRPTSPRPATPVEKPSFKSEYQGHPPDTAVLAKWVDKRYYSGKVLEMTELNKYNIKFDDGHSKVLFDDFIIFGDIKTLPLQGQSVYVMVDEAQNYEPALVLGVEENDRGTVTYRCVTDG